MVDEGKKWRKGEEECSLIALEIKDKKEDPSGRVKKGACGGPKTAVAPRNGGWCSLAYHASGVTVEGEILCRSVPSAEAYLEW